MKCSIRHGLFSSVVLLALGIGLDCTTSTGAQSDPVCLNGGSDNSLRCDFSTMQQCRSAASGGLGYCEPDPSANASDSGAELLQSARPQRPRSPSRFAH